jgi:asparagine synthase (glutamine-hydrolysing)
VCAISGIWDFQGALAVSDLCQLINRHQVSRGPDGGGIQTFLEGKLAFGHRRLSILDLSENGAQPMRSCCGRYWITFNGEIYNFMELRGELAGLGHLFHTESDTEVILAAYCQWGEECQERFNGMWAFAIWDGSEKSIFLSRDRFGVKPLHYISSLGRYFAFASQANVFGEVDTVHGRIDESYLSICLQSPFLLEGKGFTIFHGVRQLLAGCCARVSKDDFQIRRWWNTAEAIRHNEPPSYSDSVEQMRELLDDSCRLRLRSDVPVATALSGGLDSSSVYATIQSLSRVSDSPVRCPSEWRNAFSCSLPGTDLDETDGAREVAKFVGGQVDFIEPNFQNLADWVIDATTRLDFVYVTPAIMVQTYAAMKQKGFTVSLDGHGVDEMAYGYDHLVSLAMQDAQSIGNEDLYIEYKQILASMTPEWSKKMNVLDQRDRMKRPSAGQRFLEYVESGIRYRTAQLLGLDQSKKSSDPWLKQPGIEVKQELSPEIPDGYSTSEEILFREFHEKTLPTLLRNYDRVSMLSGLEIRMPFMDWRIVTFLFSLPQHYKLGGGYTKRILRDAMCGRLPDSIRLNRIKTGWNAPMVDWFTGELKEMILDTVNSTDFRNSPVWDGRKIQKWVHANYDSNSWTWGKCCRFWPFLNASILVAKHGWK